VRVLNGINSGGQDGIDVSAWDAALECGIPTAGWMPKGFLTLSGPKPEYAARYQARETPSPDWPQRTNWNVRDTAVTLILTTHLFSPGTKATLRACREHRKPVITLWVYGREGNLVIAERYAENYERFLVESSLAASLAGPLRDTNGWLNVAGNRDQALYGPAKRWLVELFCQFQAPH
jgi:hypothetical protein